VSMEHGAHANLRRPQRCARRAGAWLCDGACGACIMVSSACRGGWLGNHLVAQQREFAGWIRCSNARKAVWLDGDRRRSCADLVCHWVSEEWLMVGGWRLAQPRPRQNGCAIPISVRAASHVPPPPRPPHVHHTFTTTTTATTARYRGHESRKQPYLPIFSCLYPRSFCICALVCALFLLEL
jgi:hypothetical protein